MPNSMTPTRRTVLTGIGAGAALLASGPRPALAAPKSLTVGFIYVGPKDDFGYNQAHAEGAASLKSMQGVTILEEERVPESDDVVKTMQSMVKLDGATLVFPTSFGYFDPYMLRVAKEEPAIQFRHCGGLWEKGKHPTNAGSYFGYIAMGMYVNGIVAAHATKTKKLGFVAAKPIAQVLNNVNSFALGARSVDPSIVTTVVFTGDWSMPVKEAEATNALIDGGADVITCHVDGPKVVIQTAEGRGAYTCGYHADQSALAPKGYLTGAEWNWAKVYKIYVSKMQAGEPLPNFTRGGLADGFVKMSAYGQAVSPAARQRADAVKAEIMEGGFAVFKGPLMDNTGKQIIAAGGAYPETAIELESTNWLAEGVRGSLT